MKRAHKTVVRALRGHSGTGIILCLTMIGMISASRPAWSQSAVWQPQGATAGSIYYNGGNVGIGTASPVKPLHVVGAAGSLGPLGGLGTRDIAIFENNDIAANIAIISNTSGVARVLFGNNTQRAVGYFEYDNAANFLRTYVNQVERMRIDATGNVGIGTTNPQYKLAVEGAIGARDIIVTNTPWSDYVFQPDYRLQPLSEVNSYIQQHRHLPGIPSEAEVKEKGVSVADIQARLLAKIEELTLHMIQQEKDNGELRERLARLETQTGSGSGHASSR